MLGALRPLACGHYRIIPRTLDSGNSMKKVKKVARAPKVGSVYAFKIGERVEFLEGGGDVWGEGSMGNDYGAGTLRDFNGSSEKWTLREDGFYRREDRTCGGNCGDANVDVVDGEVCRLNWGVAAIRPIGGKRGRPVSAKVAFVLVYMHDSDPVEYFHTRAEAVKRIVALCGDKSVKRESFRLFEVRREHVVKVRTSVVLG